MGLSDEERKKIYEEERDRIEQKKAEPRDNADKNSTGKIAREGVQGRTGRIATSSFAIAWGIILLIFFYFFRHYLAYWQIENINGVPTWVRYEILTADFNRWMVILTLTLGLYIAFNIALIVYDRYILRQSANIVLNLFGVATIASLLYIFPFNFNAIPNFDNMVFSVLIKIVLAAILTIFILVTLVNIIKFIIRLATKTATY